MRFLISKSLKENVARTSHVNGPRVPLGHLLHTSFIIQAQIYITPLVTLETCCPRQVHNKNNTIHRFQFTVLYMKSNNKKLYQSRVLLMLCVDRECD